MKKFVNFMPFRHQYVRLFKYYICTFVQRQVIFHKIPFLIKPPPTQTYFAQGFLNDK
jgi:hypothetical protein